MRVFYPLALWLLIADRLLTYMVPSLSWAPGEVLKLWAKLVLKSPRPLTTSVLQGAAMAYITQEKQLFVINYFSSKRE
ncbi:hypothetical protein JTE90_025106 [Oedothorax gibbosus]|uniref:Secreted protein n=1 Tax=Oedothorax gibbosus TaxID=931172 RepID=A0AAV6U179_9ARAC|nr:hypothetical protein JTE90_025106 [Oedothorax gibbosus]